MTAPLQDSRDQEPGRRRQGIRPRRLSRPPRPRLRPRRRPWPGVALVTLDRPEALNALSFDLLDELADALAALDADPDLPGDRPHGRGSARSRPAPTSVELAAADIRLASRGRPPFRVWDRLAAIGLPDHRGGPGRRPRGWLRARDDLRHDRGRRGRRGSASPRSARRHAGCGRHAAPDPRDRQGAGDGDDPDRRADRRPAGPLARARQPGRAVRGDGRRRAGARRADRGACRRSRYGPRRPPSVRAHEDGARGPASPPSGTRSSGCSTPPTRPRAWPHSPRSARPTWSGR